MNKNQSTFAITPETKVGALLDNYPELEDILIEMAPEFKKLRNPVLKKTIAKITSLRQVAQIGHVSLTDMIRKLRAEAGIQGGDDFDGELSTDSSGKPDWFDESKIVKRLDAREMLDAGEHPVNQVLTKVKDLEKGQIYELVTPFLPAPLIDSVKGKGFQAWSHQEKPDVVRNYFTLNLT